MHDPPEGVLTSSERYAWYTSMFEEHLRQRHLIGGHLPVSDASRRPSAAALVA
jgi:hypothetical protein